MTSQLLAAHILVTIARAQQEARTSSLDSLVEQLRVRRADIRSAVTKLHREGFIDATRMRLTLAGFTLAHAMKGRAILPLRKDRSSATLAA